MKSRSRDGLAAKGLLKPPYLFSVKTAVVYRLRQEIFRLDLPEPFIGNFPLSEESSLTIYILFKISLTLRDIINWGKLSLCLFACRYFN